MLCRLQLLIWIRGFNLNSRLTHMSMNAENLLMDLIRLILCVWPTLTAAGDSLTNMVFIITIMTEICQSFLHFPLLLFLLLLSSTYSWFFVHFLCLCMQWWALHDFLSSNCVETKEKTRNFRFFGFLRDSIRFQIYLCKVINIMAMFTFWFI